LALVAPLHWTSPYKFMMFWRETGAGGPVVNENVVAVLQFGT